MEHTSTPACNRCTSEGYFIRYHDVAHNGIVNEMHPSKCTVAKVFTTSVPPTVTVRDIQFMKVRPTNLVVLLLNNRAGPSPSQVISARMFVSMLCNETLCAVTASDDIRNRYNMETQVITIALGSSRHKANNQTHTSVV